MDDKKKIVLGSEDILAKGVEDIFLNISLQRTFNQIKKEKYDNNFDLAEQFRKERNASRDFRIYGIVESTIAHTDDLPIKAYKDSGLTSFIGTVNTSPLAYNQENVYGKRKGKYLLQLNNYDSDVVYFKIEGNNLTYDDQIFEQRLVFYTLDGQFVEYGTETVDIGLNSPGFLNIENDFPFFYNKHWVKRNLDIVEEKPTVMQFSSDSSIVSEGQSISLEILMDKPSPFGNELVTLDAILGTVLPTEFNLSISGNPISFPITLSWVQGEQNKTITFDAIQDNVNEFSENLSFNLVNFQFATPGLVTTHLVTINDATPRKKTIYNLGGIYKNRLSFTGRTAQSTPSAPVVTATAYSILRNGLHFGNTNEEFYPGDTYSLYVTNVGIDTVLPINTELGVNSEQLWPSGEVRVFNIDTKYSGSEKHKVKLMFPENVIPNTGRLRINGVNMGVTLLNFDNISSKILDNSSTDYLPSLGFEKDWTAVAEGVSAITITSKTTGLPVKIDIIPIASSFGGSNAGLPDPFANPYVVDIDPYVERKQIPPKLTLYANDTGNTSTKYEFQFVKQGYNGVFVSGQTHSASEAGVNRYLVTKFKYVSRNWDDTNDSCIYSTAATQDVGIIITSQADGSPISGTLNYLHPVGSAYINGSVLLSSNALPETRLNLTKIETAEFKNYPLIVKPATNATLMVESVSQLGKLTIPEIGQTNSLVRQMYEDNAVGFRSFDFRTGTTGPFTTFYKNNQNFTPIGGLAWSSFVNASGATNVSNFLGNILDYGSTPSIQEGPVLGLDVSGNHLPLNSSNTTLYLKSKAPGVPFEIVNIVNAYVHTTASVNFVTTTTITAGDVIGPITYETLIESATQGVDPNIGKNWMGGYNTQLVVGPSVLGNINLQNFVL
jgi:hypothetical protein